MCTYDVYVLVHTYRQLTYIPAKVVFIFDYLANVISYFSNRRSTCLVKRDTDELMTLTFHLLEFCSYAVILSKAIVLGSMLSCIAHDEKHHSVICC